MEDRTERMLEMIRQRAAEFISENSNRTSLLTVTRVTASEDKKRVTVLFTVLPEEKEEEALNFFKRKRAELREYLGEHLRVYPVPFVDVELDRGEKNRQRIDELSGGR
ncbi:MAG TPA: ribosome-binding factor A [Candidatus Paceibacterota bacterium]|nr:ribosome-binding factor A [Candidatus Paceibacterota bacterium]